MSSQNSAVTLTAEQLKEIISSAVQSAVAAATAPTEEELEVRAARKAQKDMDKQMRKERADLELQRIERRNVEQNLCSHQRKDGTYNVIYIYPSGGMYQFIYCQACEAIIRPETERPTDEGKLKDCQHHIFDTRLFNILRPFATQQKTDF